MTRVAAALRTRLTAGEVLVGTVVTLPDVALAELTAYLADLVWIDLEHGGIGPGELQPLGIAARAGGAAALVRLGGARDGALGAALDAGAEGVVVPRVESAAEAELVVERLRYPPRGSRGFAARRASAYGMEPVAAADPVCMVQVESARAVDESRAIAAVDGVDALVVGCGDLALALGENSRSPSQRLREAVGEVQHAAEAAGVASGIAGPDDPELLVELADGRSTVLLLAADVRIFARALEGALSRIRGEPAHRAVDRKESHVCT
jgi:2-keto-3-deoxy-L-rhamnonate aldolase RhmA